MPLTEQEEFELLSLEREKAMQSQRQPTQSTQQPQQQEQKSSILSQLVRSVMRNAPLEQLKTSQSMAGNVPEVQQGQSLSDYAKSYQQQLQPRESQITQQGTIPQFNDLMQAGLLVGGAEAPVQTAKLLGKFGILEGISEVTGLNKSIQNIKEPTVKDIADISKFIVEGGLASKKWTPESVKEFGTKLASRTVNSLIRPSHKEWMFGKNPGRGIAKEGIVAVSMEDLYAKVDTKITELHNQSKVIRALPENLNNKVDLTDTIKPLEKVYAELNKAPESHQAEITKVQAHINDLTNTKKLNQVNLEDAYEIKGIVKNMQSWKTDTEGGKLTNIALREVYHNIDAKIDTSVPKLKSLNERMADLISAKTAIEHRVERLQSVDPMGWKALVDLPFKAYRTTLSKTTLARLLSKKY